MWQRECVRVRGASVHGVFVRLTLVEKEALCAISLYLSSDP